MALLALLDVVCRANLRDAAAIAASLRLCCAAVEADEEDVDDEYAEADVVEEEEPDGTWRTFPELHGAEREWACECEWPRSGCADAGTDEESCLACVELLYPDCFLDEDEEDDEEEDVLDLLEIDRTGDRKSVV